MLLVMIVPTCTSLRLVLTNGSMTPDMDSVLSNVTIDRDGNQVILTCHFRTDISHSLHVQCIVVVCSSTKLDLMVKFTQGKWLSSGCYQEPIGTANAALQCLWATDVIHRTNCVGHTVNIHI